MTRVSENSGQLALNHAISIAKQKLEDLQLKGSTLKRISRPSDDPTANVDYLAVGARINDQTQYIRNAGVALSQLDFTERALSDLTEVVLKAKEIAIAQGSDLYNAEVRKNVAKEIAQIRNQILSIANRRFGNRHVFSGHATLTKPFTTDGKYVGDSGKISLEVAKDFFVTINLNGAEVFAGSANQPDREVDPLKPFPQLKVQNLPTGPTLVEQSKNSQDGEVNRLPANLESQELSYNLFSLMDQLQAGLENNDGEMIRDSLVPLDDALDRINTLRTRLGAVYSSIMSAQSSVEMAQVEDAAFRSKVADADVAKLYSDLSKQQNVLQATYKSGHAILNKTLLDFLR